MVFRMHHNPTQREEPMNDDDITLDDSSLFGFSQYEKVGDESQNIKELHSKSDEAKVSMNPDYVEEDAQEAAKN